jgi:hypothetical protein
LLFRGTADTLLNVRIFGKETKEMTAQEKRAAVIGGLCIVGLGIAAIVSPDLMSEAEVSGRNGLLKRLVAWAWSVPGGIIAIALGSASVWKGFRGSSKS